MVPETSINAKARSYEECQLLCYRVSATSSEGVAYPILNKLKPLHPMCLLALPERYHLPTNSSSSSTTPPSSRPRARCLAFNSNPPRLPLHHPKDFSLGGKKRRTSRYRAALYTGTYYPPPLPCRKLCPLLPLCQALSPVSIQLFPQYPRLSFNVAAANQFRRVGILFWSPDLSSSVSFAEWEGCSETAEKIES
jgi:hypothetical protein